MRTREQCLRVRRYDEPRTARAQSAGTALVLPSVRSVLFQLYMLVQLLLALLAGLITGLLVAWYRRSGTEE